ncbi:FAD-dependent oxidoreductase [Phytoactinopolyspora alkaliphila]|uniref:FAD-dependent oxidoreductase n=1 Tax=Phytoactinopolyspora alkaliphila TaxID=1783498 RepID=A0A6N9YHP2_9ACTN|nr:NAD(P)/FAD-dependent oxidoreductase [Phytoactinopolyspora alkaliphila]NED94389.1 FAD-dependent oxidoreductase [Phytoactinopolyspora alkaliphila]
MPDWTLDVAVVGAGPAGLAAAAAAAHTGTRVGVVDNGRRPGGQFWRHPVHRGHEVADLQHDVHTFAALAPALHSVTYLSVHDVWSVARTDGGFTIRALHQDAEVTVHARTLVLATGAYDRQLPFPGWDLPGVYTAGGAQALLKGHQVAVGPRVVVGGTGPFLLPVAAGLARRGAHVRGVFEANRTAGWLRHLPAVTGAGAKAAEATGYAATLARHRVPYRGSHAVVAAHGDGHVEAVTVARLNRDWSVRPGSERTVACDAVAVGWGFTPRLELPLALGCATRVDVDGSVVVDVDHRQASSVPGVYVAGEATGVGGAALAVLEGEIAGLAATSLPTHHLLRHRAALRRFAAAMHAVHPVRDGWQDWLSPETVVCRCEEVTVSSIRSAVHQLGATDARSVKLMCRAGMGWCQGRICGFPAGVIAAAETGRPADLRGLSERPIAVPIPLGVLAAAHEDHPGTARTLARTSGAAGAEDDPPRREHKG